MCFRNIKSAYLGVKSKRDLLAIHGLLERRVQETYSCPEVSRRYPAPATAVRPSKMIS